MSRYGMVYFTDYGVVLCTRGQSTLSG